MKIDINKKYRTRDGREVIIHAINGPDGAFPVVASVQNSSAWMAGKWRITGTGAIESADLIEVREPREGWIPDYYLYETKEAAKRVSSSGVIIRVREIID
jgi:hypothetical protein